jgi:hypothetical protein
MKDGGAAFPELTWERDPFNGAPVSCTVGGMTLRDWFAGQYLTTFGDSSDYPAIAHMCYEMADAMISKREADEAKEEGKA